LPRPRVKICGLTRPEDARLAVSLGADAIGLNFYPASPRVIPVERVAALVSGLPAFVTVVGLFVDPTREQVEAAVQTGLLQCLQFHGNETPEFCASFRIPFLKAVRVNSLESARECLQKFGSSANILLDTYVAGQAGGTGKVFDWDLAGRLVRESRNPIILAGGLTPDNVQEALLRVQPYGVDVSSGVESAPGIKDSDKLQRFFHAVDSLRATAGSGRSHQ